MTDCGFKKVLADGARVEQLIAHPKIDDWIHVFRKTKPAPGTNGPLIPGDPEREAEAIRSKEGIPLIKPVVDDLLEISKQTGVAFEVK